MKITRSDWDSNRRHCSESGTNDSKRFSVRNPIPEWLEQPKISPFICTTTTTHCHSEFTLLHVPGFHLITASNRRPVTKWLWTKLTLAVLFDGPFGESFYFHHLWKCQNLSEKCLNANYDICEWSQLRFSYFWWQKQQLRRWQDVSIDWLLQPPDLHLFLIFCARYKRAWLNKGIIYQIKGILLPFEWGQLTT